MSNKVYAVMLVLAGMVFGILLVSLTSSPAAARLPDEGRNATMNASATARPGAVKPVPARTTPTRPVPARPDIRVYPIGMDRNGSHNHAHAYVVKDGRLYYCEDQTARSVGLN